MAIKNLLVAIVVCLLLSPLAQADTIYVNNISGSDLNDGASPEHKGEGIGPLKSLTGALKRVQRGDKIELAKTESPYKECVTLQGRRHSGTSYAPFVIDGNGATLDGVETVPAHRWEHVYGDVFRFVPDRTGYQQLFLDDAAAKRMPKFDAMYNTSFLAAKQWCRCKGGIHFATEKDTSIHNYELSYAKHSVGITLYDVQNVVIHDLQLRGFQLDGINAHDNAFECVLSDVTSTENGRSGVSVGGSSRLHLAKCDLRDNGDSQLRAEGWSTTNLHATKLVSNEVPAWKREPNQFSRGARLVIDGTKQVDTVGWWTDKDEEEGRLKLGLDMLEDKVDTAVMDAPETETREPARENPLDDVADDDPQPADDGPIFEDEAGNEDNVEPADFDAAGEDDPFGNEDPFGGDIGDDAGNTEDGGEEDLFEDFGGDFGNEGGDLFE